MKIRIDQFLPAAAEGDGVTGSALLFQRLLHEAGYNSRLIAGNRPQALSNDIDTLDENQRLDSEPDLLLVHHSMGHDLGHIITATACPKVMIYHNITPAEMFAPESGEARYSVIGRQQLHQWRTCFLAAVGVSPLNCNELTQVGYSDVTCIPALVDPGRFKHNLPSYPPKGVGWNRSLLLAVGRVAENKRQHLMIEAMAYLKKMLPAQECPQLIISGGTTSPQYGHYLQALAQQYQLGRNVLFVGKTTEAELKWLYEHAKTLWCTSEHEGFCMPLVEANAFDLPVIAMATSNIPATLGASGLLLDTDSPEILAATTAELLTDPALQATLKHAGQLNLEQFKPERLLQNLKALLDRIMPFAVKDAL